MPQVGTDSRPVILKNKKRGNRKLGLGGKHLSKKDKELYSKGWDRIFGKQQKNYNRQKG
tara:strand:- start:4041 stop:4217 length:177 start_codon:yes stop_codon:yes gene_type:complete